MKIFIGLPLFLKLLSTGAVGLEALFKRESIGNRNITEGQFIRHNIITTTSTRGLDECALKSKLIFNSENSGVFCFKNQECIVSDCPYQAVAGTSDEGWSCYANIPTTVTPLFYTAHVAAEQLSHTLMRMQDGLYYFYLLVEDSAPYQDAKEYCEQLPGFHLPIVITQKQFDTVTSFPEPGPVDFWLALAVKNGEEVWENGVPFSVTTSNTGKGLVIRFSPPGSFRMQGDKINDIDPNLKQRVLCQGNLDEIDILQEL